jgi:hypothetical protein
MAKINVVKVHRAKGGMREGGRLMQQQAGLPGEAGGYERQRAKAVGARPGATGSEVRKASVGGLRAWRQGPW